MNLRIAFGFTLAALAFNAFAHDLAQPLPDGAQVIAEESGQRPLGKLIDRQQQRLQEPRLAEESGQRPLGRLIERQQHQLLERQDNRMADASRSS